MTTENNQAEAGMIDDEATAAGAVREKLADASSTPGFQAEFDPEEAARAGAFQEDALSEADAQDATIDLPEAQEDVPTFVEDGAPLDVPANPTTANARQLFGKRPGESVGDALDRNDDGQE